MVSCGEGRAAANCDSCAASASLWQRIRGGSCAGGCGWHSGRCVPINENVHVRRCSTAAADDTVGFVTWYGHGSLTAPIGQPRHSPGKWDDIEMTRNLVLSIHAFTCKAVVVVGVSAARAAMSSELRNALPAARFPRLRVRVVEPLRIRRRFSGDFHLQKLHAILGSGLSRGIYLDSDSIVTPFVHRLFEMLDAERGHAMPLLPLHPCDGSVDANPTSGTPATPYLHANVILFPSEESRRFLRTVLEALDSLSLPVAILRAHDESALNAVLRRHANRKFLCTVDPLFHEARRRRTLPVGKAWVQYHARVPMEQLVVHAVRGDAQLRAMREWAHPTSWRAAFHLAGEWLGGVPRDLPVGDSSSGSNSASAPWPVSRCVIDAGNDTTVRGLVSQRPCVASSQLHKGRNKLS